MPHLALLTVAALTLPLIAAARQPTPVTHGDTQLLLDHRSAFAEYPRVPGPEHRRLARYKR